MSKSLLKLTFLVLIPIISLAQDPVKTAQNYIFQNRASANLQSVQNLEIALSSFYKPIEAKYNYVYFNQRVNDIPVFNALYNVVLDAKENVIHSTHTFENELSNLQKVEQNNLISAKDALFKAMESVNIDSKGVNLAINEELKNTQGLVTQMVYDNSLGKSIVVKLEWLPQKYFQFEPQVKKNMALTWSVSFEGKTKSNQWLVHLDAVSGEVLKVDDLVIHCTFGESEEEHRTHVHGNSQLNTPFAANSYNVFDIPLESPNHGARTTVTNPYTRFIPLGTGPGTTNGWHSNGTSDFTYTRGNNVWAQEDVNGNDGVGYSPNSSTLEFDFPYTQGLATASGNQNAAITNLFYWNNLLHDVLYKYGFDEPSGNFQNFNMGRGGLGGDFVIAEAQDGSDSNNANFYTPIDGVANPQMQMFLWSNAGGYQPDSDFDNGVITHEYGHGWSVRLTGGPSTNTCLQNAEQGGEGWSDYLALMLTTNWPTQTPTLASANVPRGIGTYVKGQTTSGAGIRPYRYSYDMASINPLVTYGNVSNTSLFSQPHGIGSIWATILWDMTWEIIMQDEEIINDIWNTDRLVGNVAALKLVHEGLRLQPCSPSFVDARNAILLADMIYFGGRYRCSIDKSFARRGLGGNATTGKSSNDREVFEDFSLLTGPKLTSPTQLSTCSGQPFNYTATSTGSGTTFNWTRATVSGISNSAGSGTTSVISETLVNTTINNIVVTYKIFISPTTCGFPPFGYEVKVTVKPTPQPQVQEYNICQNGTVPTGEGLVGIPGSTFSVNTLNESIVLNSSSPTFTRYNASSGSHYYKSSTFTSNYAGTYVIDLILSSGDPYLFVYSNFNSTSPSSNLLAYDDDSGDGLSSRITLNLTLGQTITIVSSSYHSLYAGNYTLTVNPTSGPAVTHHYWFKDAITTTALSTNQVFNPVGVSGSGLSDTSVPGTYTYYYSSDQEKLCRVPVYFMIRPNNVGGTLAPVAPICSASNVVLSLSGHIGEIIRWEKSTNDFTSYITLLSTANPLTLNHVSESAKYRALVGYEGGCSPVYSNETEVIVLPVNEHINNDISSGTIIKKVSQAITADNKITPPASVTYKAGKSITLQPGFEANTGSVFLANIEGCNN